LPHASEFWEARRIGGQLIDAATSMAMNYRAAGRGRSHREFTAKLGLVVEEADESLGWLELMTQLELARGSESTWRLGESRELVAIFGSSYRTAKENRRHPPPDRQAPDRRSSNRRSPDRPIADPPTGDSP
jgi:four helix bundle protein